MSQTVVYDIYGFKGCGYATEAADLAAAQPNALVYRHFVERAAWANTIAALKEKIGKAKRRGVEPRLRDYRTSPMVFVRGVFIGGYDDLEAYVAQA